MAQLMYWQLIKMVISPGSHPPADLHSKFQAGLAILQSSEQVYMLIMKLGAAGATGRGEEVIRTCGSFLAVELMRQGKSPQQACEAIARELLM